MTDHDAGVATDADGKRLAKKARIHRSRADLLRYFSRQFDELDASKGDGDSCQHEQQAANDALKAVTDIEDDLATMSRAQAQTKQEIAGYTKKRDKASSAEDKAKWQAKIDDDQAEADRRDSRMEQAKTRLNKAEDTLEDRVADLKECRKNHPLDTRCGSRGGVGVERPSGKCAGWYDWRRRDGGYY